MREATAPWKRLVAAMLATVMGVGLLSVATASPAQAQVPTDTFCANATTENPFTDVADNDQNIDNILCLVSAEITVGTTPTTYEPAESVNRRQMALFIKRLIDTANELQISELEDLPAYDGTPDFSDVTADDPGAEAIGQLDQAGIVQGFTDGTYQPNEFVDRDQMASFIARAINFLGDDLPAGDNAFTDDEGNVHEANINALAAAEIVLGTGPGIYSPDADVTRRQMASFLIRGLAYLEANGDIEPLPGDPGEPDPNPNDVFEFDPSDPQTVTGINNPDMDTSDDVTFTVSDLMDTPYRVTLVACANITASDDDDDVFVEDGDTGLAAAGTVAADITAVNGAPQPDGDLTMEGVQSQSVGGIVPVMGEITFTVDAESVDECFRPVIYTDQGGDNTRLNLDDNGEPTEPFGVGPTVTVIATAGNPNEQLNITPQEDVTRTFVAPNPDTDTTDDVQYSVTGLDQAEEYRVTLVACENITQDANDDATFAELMMGGMGQGVADPGALDADITVVNGTPTAAAGGADTQTVGGIAPVGGTINFTVDGEAEECVTPVIYLDNADDGGDTRLEIDDEGQPTEPFGIGGSIEFLPAEAAGGAFDVRVDNVAKDMDRFTGSDRAGGPTIEGTFFYDANDTFTVDGVPATLADFEAELSNGDFVSGTYSPDPALVSSFALVDRRPRPPINVTATQTDGDVEVSFDQRDEVDSFTVQRATAVGAAPADCAATPDTAYADVGTVPGGADGDTLTFTDEDVAPDQYCYRVIATTDGDDSEPSAPAFIDVLAPPEMDAPIITDLRVTRDTGTAGVLDATGVPNTDRIRFDFDEEMNPDLITEDASFQFTDDQGETFQIRCGGTTGNRNADCTFADGSGSMAANDALLVDLLEAPTKVGGVGDGLPNLPGELTQLSAAFSDVAGNPVDLADSDGDTTINIQI